MNLYKAHVLLCTRCQEPFVLEHDQPHEGKEPVLPHLCQRHAQGRTMESALWTFIVSNTDSTAGHPHWSSSR